MTDVRLFDLNELDRLAGAADLAARPCGDVLRRLVATVYAALVESSALARHAARLEAENARMHAARGDGEREGSARPHLRRASARLSSTVHVRRHRARARRLVGAQ